MRTIFNLALISAFTTIYAVSAQEVPPIPPIKNPPVVAEAMFSSNGMLFHTLIQKKLISAPKFGFMGVSEIAGKWADEKPDEYMVQGNITYELTSGLDLMGGFHMTSGASIRPAFGVLYVYTKKDLFLMLNPRYYIDDIADLEGFIIGEYRPEISRNWKFYSRIQGMYNFTADGGVHARSYARLRAGVSNREFSFGLAGNAEFYGPQKINENSLGIFFNVALF